MQSDERRYYARLQKKSRSFALRMDKKQWCDLHHQHFDWNGRGNTSRVHRVLHLNALLRALRRARIELAAYGLPYQLFAYIDLENSANDALYVHTPNPNGSEFPNPIESVSTLVPAPPILAARVDASQYEVRRYREGAVYYVVPKSSGAA